ncbi:MAG: flavin reductase [Clostridia bacterium]
MSLLFKITYGLYLLSAEANGKCNACMINTVLQQTSSPEQVSITVNKQNFTTGLIENSRRFVINILSTDTPFDFIKNFGMQSGANIDKFKNIETVSSATGIKTNKNNSVGFLEIEVTSQVDLGTHIMYVGKIVESFAGIGEPLTYAFYHSNIKPKPDEKPSNTNEEVWVCQICGYVHKGAMPDDFVCPICKHGKSDFVRK